MADSKTRYAWATDMRVAFLALGFLVGNLTGLSASPLAGIIVPAAFTLVGGSALAFLSKVPERDRPIASGAILLFSIGCLLGVYIGVLVNTQQWLGPRPFVTSSDQDKSHSSSYLRSETLRQSDLIDQRVRGGEFTREQAYQKLRETLSKD
jgi:hypothetical protein